MPDSVSSPRQMATSDHSIFICHLSPACAERGKRASFYMRMRDWAGWEVDLGYIGAAAPSV